MKLSIFALTSILGTSSAFVAPRFSVKSTAVAMADIEASEVFETEELTPIEPPTPELPEMSMSMPFMKRPAALTGKICLDFLQNPLFFSNQLFA